MTSNVSSNSGTAISNFALPAIFPPSCCPGPRGLRRRRHTVHCDGEGQAGTPWRSLPSISMRTRVDVMAAETYRRGWNVGSKGAPMAGNRVKVGIVGLGRWANVLTRAAKQSDALEIVAGYSRTEEKRAAFAQQFGISGVSDLNSMLADP